MQHDVEHQRTQGTPLIEPELSVAGLAAEDRGDQSPPGRIVDEAVEGVDRVANPDVVERLANIRLQQMAMPRPNRRVERGDQPGDAASGSVGVRAVHEAGVEMCGEHLVSRRGDEAVGDRAQQEFPRRVVGFRNGNDATRAGPVPAAGDELCPDLADATAIVLRQVRPGDPVGAWGDPFSFAVREDSPQVRDGEDRRQRRQCAGLERRGDALGIFRRRLARVTVRPGPPLPWGGDRRP